MSGGLPGWIGGFFSAIVSEVGEVFKDDAGGSNSEPVEGKSNSSNDINPLNWVREGLSEIGSHVVSVFKDDAGGSDSVPVEGKSNSSAQERGKASYIQGEDLEIYTEQQLEEFGLNANWYPPENKLLFDETSEKFGKLTQVEVTIEDDNGEELAIIECKAYGPNSRLSGPNAVDQVNRLIHVAEERGIPLIFSTSDGTTDCFGKDVMEVLNQTQCFVISVDNIFFADPSDVKETGVTPGLPPDLQDHWEGFGTGTQSESIDTHNDSSNDRDSVDNNSNSENSNVYYDLFGNRYEETSSSNTSDNSSNDSENSGGFWDFFGGSNSGSSDTSDNSSGDYGSSDTSDYSSSDSGDTGGSWDLFGSSYDSSPSDTSDYSSSDNDSDSSSDSSYSSSDWW
ncbi:hypothetical protein NG798_01340 [Ancylothrix sp. C2]|uniref:hypothetical protein n=1 Tax=Ancylothrix sp. D3o TaxID=2953691 RepID=UPI0021BA5F9B|nr:hypothetical protein [Ancylothrix sp. D3o]MCT7948424.1 hypothetical protein [Ancylothrix sp. D3o]